MFTSRAENRLSLRAETAPLRLGSIAIKYNLYSNEQKDVFVSFQKHYKELMFKIKKISCIYKNKKEPLVSLLKRPGTFLEQLKNKEVDDILACYGPEIIFAVETAIKYEGYEVRENKRNEKIKGMENQRIPADVDYRALSGLSNESKEKLGLIRPQTLGRASRIDGVRSSDVAVLSIYLNKVVSRETKR